MLLKKVVVSFLRKETEKLLEHFIFNDDANDEFWRQFDFAVCFKNDILWNFSFTFVLKNDFWWHFNFTDFKCQSQNRKNLIPQKFSALKSINSQLASRSVFNDF